MTKQETFDRIVDGLRKQGCKSQSIRQSTGMLECRYRGDNGTKCGAGQVIPDSKYRPEMENRRADCGLVAIVLEEEGHDPDLVRKLQIVHDNYSVPEWENGFWNVAREFRLIYKEPANEVVLR